MKWPHAAHGGPFDLVKQTYIKVVIAHGRALPSDLSPNSKLAEIKMTANTLEVGREERRHIGGGEGGGVAHTVTAMHAESQLSSELSFVTIRYVSRTFLPKVVGALMRSLMCKMQNPMHRGTFCTVV